MKIRIRQGDLEVLTSGTVHISNDESTSIILNDEFNIIFEYLNDEKDTEQKLQLRQINEGVAIAITNFNNPLGTATNKPISIASTQGQTIYLTFSISAIGTSKIMTYVLYSGK